MRAVPVAYWLACAPTELWLEDDDGTLSEWEEPCGDRRQELVLIGQSMPRDIIEAALERCLLTDLEMARGPTNGGTSPIRFRTGMCPDRYGGGFPRSRGG